MAEAHQTLLRQVTMLRLIPRLPHSISASELRDKLERQGFSVTLRTIQRDLSELSTCFTLVADEGATPYRWSFTKDAPLDLAAMDPTTALALHLSEGHLSTLLPRSVLDQIEPQFHTARNYLDSLNNNGLAHWARRVRALPNGKTLIPADIAHDIWAAISTALVEQKQLQVGYLSRRKAELKQFRLHPVGLVARHSISYLIATVNDYDDLRQFAMHRIKQAELLGEAARPRGAFDIDDYVASGAFSLRQSAGMIDLIADVHPQTAWLLSETPISAEQSLEPLPDSDWQRLRACVPMDQETLWWIFGLNDNIRVWEPAEWVEEIKGKLENMSMAYRS